MNVNLELFKGDLGHSLELGSLDLLCLINSKDIIFGPRCLVILFVMPLMGMVVNLYKMRVHVPLFV